MTDFVLRPDQQQLSDGFNAGWSRGLRNMLAVLPTGGGKSVIVSKHVKAKLSLGASQAVIAHRNELVSQMSCHIAREGIPHRVIAPKKMVGMIIAKHRKLYGDTLVNQQAQTSVVGVDTMIARSAELMAWAAQQDFWTIDEAHHVLRLNKWGKAVEMLTNGLGLGVTATPRRADGRGLGRHADGVFDEMVVGPSARQLMDLGAITDYEYVVPQSDFEIGDDAIAANGDFGTVKMREASKKSHIVGDIVANYCRFAARKQAIVFATDVETAGEIAQQFNTVGISAAAVCGTSDPTYRDDMVERFRDGRLTVLVNVDLFGEGFDVPACECVILARPTASIAVFLQQCGRALRTMLGKLYGLIIDHVSNYKRHGLPDKYQFWTLDRREKRAKKEPDPEEVKTVACTNCSRPYEAVHASCPRCGHVPEVTPAARGQIEMIDGDLILLDRVKLAEMRAATELEAPSMVAQRVAFATNNPIAGKAAMNNQMERIATQKKLSDIIALWAGHQRAKGRDDQQSYRRFYLTAGVDVLTALAQPRAEMERLAQMVEGWIQ